MKAATAFPNRPAELPFKHLSITVDHDHYMQVNNWIEHNFLKLQRHKRYPFERIVSKVDYTDLGLFLLNSSELKELRVIHINKNFYDFRRCNLEIASHQEWTLWLRNEVFPDIAFQDSAAALQRKAIVEETKRDISQLLQRLGVSQ